MYVARNYFILNPIVVTLLLIALLVGKEESLITEKTIDTPALGFKWSESVDTRNIIGLVNNVIVVTAHKLDGDKIYDLQNVLIDHKIIISITTTMENEDFQHTVSFPSNSIYSFKSVLDVPGSSMTIEITNKDGDKIRGIRLYQKKNLLYVEW